MRAPSTKRLTETFRDLTTKQANLIRRLAHAANDTDALASIIERECPATHAYRKQCYSDPMHTQSWRVTVVLHAIDRVLGTHGVEPLGRPLDAPPFEYCNAGDSYSATLIYSHDADALRIGCYADIVERHPSWEREERTC